VVIAADACFDRSSLSHRVALGELSLKYATVMLTDEVERFIATRPTTAPPK
jgi:isochorismate hydrolase